jgi:hypothetical protein
MMQALGSTVLCSTSSYALLLTEEIEKRGIKDKIKLKKGVIGSERWSDKMRARIAEGLGIELYDIYGLTEIYGPGIGINCEHNTGMHIWDDFIYLEIIDPKTGERQDRTDYPMNAVREAVLNALVHRDYSIHTEGMPIQLTIFADRLEIRNPGGLYGRITVDQLGKVQPDTRNPVLATALEVLDITENRYSGIPTIRREMQENGLPEPVFANERGEFSVTFYQKTPEAEIGTDKTAELLAFCKTPRTRQEIAAFLGLSSVTYAIKRYVQPLVEKGVIRQTIPDAPGSPKQKYVVV